ncbi:MAG: methionyl-tRNA synthetase [Acidimicrobiales bacterium]|jgi:methionyl-tRNA synthetase
MKDKTPRYLTTTLPYVNAEPHIGFGLEMVQADALARYWRLMGEEVFFTTGTDEHGQKIAQKADEAGQDRQEYVDHFAEQFSKLKSGLNLSYDNFIRTTDDSHKEAAQAIWKLCKEKGDIYKKKYKGLYCVGDEMYMKESELVDGRCPNHPNMELQEIEEENYFFKLSNYQEYLEEYLSQEGVIEPEWRRQEAINFVKGGLEDFSISREVSRMDWGIPVPGDEEQVMYVWFDALTNYISTLGWPEDTEGNFKKFWTDGEVTQVAGKDQIRFQSVTWQAMLKSAEVKATDKVVYHGFINSGGQKMSKSLGNVIAPCELVEKYGTDATRYILLRHIHPFDDSDLTWEKMDEYYTANLVNGLGNLTARIMKMAETHLEKEVFDEPEYKSLVALKEFNFQKALDDVWNGIQIADGIIADTEPFKLIKTEPAEAKAILVNLRKALYLIASQLKPFMPDTSETILQAIVENKKPENLFNRLES